MAASAFASVVFLKVQELARRPASEQHRLRAQLEAVVAVASAELEPAARIVLEASDGVAIVVLRDPAAALRLAERAMAASAAGLPLSGGINHGQVQPASGNGKDNGARGMAGDGIAVAASVAEFASPSRLLTSRGFRDALAEAAPGQEAALLRVGTFADPGLRVHEIFNPDRGALRRRARRHLGLAALLVVALLGGGIAVRIARDGQKAFAREVAARYDSALAKGRSYLERLIPRRAR